LSHAACLESSLSAGNETVIGMTAILGYARVSSIGQDLDAQLAALDAAGVEASRVFTEKLSGAVNTSRPGLAAMLHYARTGDTVVVTAIDRLGRSVVEVTRTIADLGERGILLRALREGIDTTIPTGRAVASIMATLAELELELGRERRATSRESRRTDSCPRLSRPSSPPIDKSYFVALRRPVNQSENWPRPLALDEQPRTAILLSSSQYRDSRSERGHQPRPRPGSTRWTWSSARDRQCLARAFGYQRVGRVG
jgi:hypothetical protein